MAAIPTITQAELVEAREKTDAGLRLAMPWLFDGLGGTAEPEPMETEDVRFIAEAIETAREELVRGAMLRLDECRDRNGASELHLKIGEAVLDLEEVQRRLAEVVGS